MMSKSKSWTRFVVSVAMACSDRERPDFPLNARDAAAFVLDVLHIALNDRAHRLRIQIVPYPVTTKVPLIVRMDDTAPYLFWYYPTRSREQVAEDVTELVMKLQSAGTRHRVHA